MYIKKKESLVLAFLDKNIKSHNKPIDDKIIDNLCVKRRPDRLYDLEFFYLIIEIDILITIQVVFMIKKHKK